MELTKYRHSCVRIDDGDRTLVVDPGVFSDAQAALEGAGAVLITHEHADHVDADRLRAAAKADPRLRIWGPAPVAEAFTDLGEQMVAVGVDESFEAAGFAVRTFGGQHAVIHPSIPVVANLAYLIEGVVYHPGDSLVVPPADVEALLLPAVAPWSKMAEVIDFAVAVRAPRVHPIHDAIVSDLYLGILQRNTESIFAGFGIQLRAWDGSVSA